MKIIAAVAIVAFCGVLQISASTPTFLEQRKLLTHAQIHLLNATTRVLMIQEQIASLEDIVNIPLEFTTNATALFDNAIKSIDDKVKAAVASGKPAGICSTTALASLTALNRTVLAEFARTGGNITDSLFEFLHQTDIVVELARSIGVHLFQIPTNCHNVDRAESRACEARLFGNLTKSIESYMVAVDNILRLAESPEALLGLINSLANLRPVLAQTLTAASAGIEAIKLAATTCINALQLVPISPARLGLPGLSL